MKTSRVLLVAGHSVVRLGLRTALAASPTTVVGTANTALEAERLAAELEPDLVVLDPSLPDADELKALRRIGHACPQTRIIFLSDRDDEEFVEEALLAGASCYLLKQTAATDLCLAILAAQRGHEYFSPTLIERLRDPAATVPEPNQLEDLPVPVASRVDAQLMAMLNQGMLIRQLAQELRAEIAALSRKHPGLLAKLNPQRRLPSVRGWRRFARRLFGVRPTPQPAHSGAT
jgi:DNA-binding NarL/FixJ family response regulator